MRILLYATVDLNLVDGSSVWLASLTELLAAHVDCEVTVLSRTPIRRRLVLASVDRLSNVTVVDPWERRLLDGPASGRSASTQRLEDEQAARLLERMLPKHSLAIVRGDGVLHELLSRRRSSTPVYAYICDPAWYDEPWKRKRLSVIARSAAGLLCQTEPAKEAILERVPDASARDIHHLPPMVPTSVAAPRTGVREPESPRLVYAGKFSPPYKILEMLEVFEELRDRLPGAEFHVIGDKFHNAPPVPNFESRLRRRLLTTGGVFWRGSVDRTTVAELTRGADLAASWRDTHFDESVELSTKVLESAALAVPPLLNRNPVTESVFGTDYPGYVGSREELRERVLELATDPERYARASQRCAEVAEAFTYRSVAERLAPILGPPARAPAPARPISDRRVVLVAGHELHFVAPLTEALEASGLEVRVDRWRGHDRHDEAQSVRLLEGADVVLCEWCLGNAVWYSHRVGPRQRLVVRLHQQELDLHYLDRLNWEAVHSLVLISRENLRELQRRYPQYQSKMTFVPNLFSTASFDLEKLPGAEFNLGFVGMVPMRKNVGLALEIFRRLKQEDSRYTLYVLGRPPEAYPWMQTRPREMRYYREIWRWLEAWRFRDAVVFDGHTTDVPSWYSKIGFILSTSDWEGSHQAVAEGMAAGSIPVIRDWAGARDLYPSEYVFRAGEDATKIIREVSRPKLYPAVVSEVKSYARRHFDSSAVLPRLLDILLGGPSGRSSYQAIDFSRAAP